MAIASTIVLSVVIAYVVILFLFLMIGMVFWMGWTEASEIDYSIKNWRSLIEKTEYGVDFVSGQVINKSTMKPVGIYLTEEDMEDVCTFERHYRKELEIQYQMIHLEKEHEEKFGVPYYDMAQAAYKVSGQIELIGGVGCAARGAGRAARGAGRAARLARKRASSAARSARKRASSAARSAKRRAVQARKRIRNSKRLSRLRTKAKIRASAALK